MLELQRPLRRRATLFLAFTVALALSGCVNPNAIGVQDFGTIVGVVYVGQTSAPVSGALVASAGRTSTTNGSGGFTLQVPVGEQTVTINLPPGYTYQGQTTYQTTVNVIKNQQSDPISLAVDKISI